jgi:glycosyltransferase involved in cell wall biosynthesis
MQKNTQLESLPLVCIIILTKNSSKSIECCLNSVINQTYSNIEVVIVDSGSNDNTLDIARRYSQTIVNSKWKLLGSKYLGYKASSGKYVLFLDSDQVLYLDAVERATSIAEEVYDMLCLEEQSYEPDSFLEKLINADRRLVNEHASLHLDPLKGVLIPRFYRSEILGSVFDKLPVADLQDVVFFDDSIIYYEAYKVSTKVGIVSTAVLHKDILSIFEFCYKSYLYGKTTQKLHKTELYPQLIKRKARRRKGLSHFLPSLFVDQCSFEKSTLESGTPLFSLFFWK